MSSKLSQCPTGKVCYSSRQHAKKAMKGINNSGEFLIRMKQVYKCETCTYWHLSKARRGTKKYIKPADLASEELKKLRASVIKNRNCK